MARYQNVDPSIRRAAASLIVEAMNGIESALLAGGHFYIERDRFLEANADKWVRLYGKECADTAARGIYALEREEMLSREAKATLDRRWKADRLRFLETHDKGRNSWLNRAWIHVFGLRLY